MLLHAGSYCQNGSFGTRAVALTLLVLNLAKRRFYRHFGGIYRYDRLYSLSKLLCNIKELIWNPRTGALALL